MKLWFNILNYTQNNNVFGNKRSFSSFAVVVFNSIKDRLAGEVDKWLMLRKYKDVETFYVIFAALAFLIGILLYIFICAVLEFQIDQTLLETYHFCGVLAVIPSFLLFSFNATYLLFAKLDSLFIG